MPVKNKHRSRNKAAEQNPPKERTPAEGELRSKQLYRSSKIRTPEIADLNQNSLIEPFPDLEYDFYETQDLDGLISLVTFHVGKSKGYGAFLLPTLRRAFLKAVSGIEERVRFARSALFRLQNFDAAEARSKSMPESYNIARNMQWAIGENVRRMLQSDGRSRTSEAKEIKALLCDAVDQLAVGEEWKYPANKEVVEIHRDGFILNHADFPGSKGWANIGEMPIQTDFPLACIAIETARQLTARLRRLPTKGEVKTKIIFSYPEVKTSQSVRRTETLSAPMWSKIWQDAGLKSLKRGDHW